MEESVEKESVEKEKEEGEVKRAVCGRDMRLSTELEGHITGLTKMVNGIMDRHNAFYGLFRKEALITKRSHMEMLAPVFGRFVPKWLMVREFLQTLEMTIQELYDEEMEVRPIFESHPDGKIR